MVLKETILTVYQFRFSFFKSSLFILQLKATELNIKVGKKNSLWIELCQKYKDIIVIVIAWPLPANYHNDETQQKLASW